MRALSFRVQNYRNIEDSGWIALDRVTALVGRNESGKTALLRALHKFNPATKELFDGQREFPRDRFTTEFKDSKKWPVCSVKFEIEGEVARGIAALLPENHPTPHTATCTRYYDNHLTVSFDPPISLPPVSPKPVLDALTAFAKAARRLEPPAPEQEDAVKTERVALAQWAAAAQEKLKGVTGLRDQSGLALLDSLRAEVESNVSPRTADMVEALQAVVGATLDDARRQDPGPAARQLVADAMPVFIYFENYGVLDSAVWLSRFIEDRKCEPSNPRVRTISAMFEHVGLFADELHALGQDVPAPSYSLPFQPGHPHYQPPPVPSPEVIAANQKRREERAIKLSSASAAITRSFGEWWSQRRHKIRYDADGDFFRIWVADNRRPDVEVELEARSKGFQWFFSFYLVFLVESGEGHKDAILLLDEPGLNLHPTAQQELIAFFEKLSERNQLIYSTHSPFLIDGENLQRVRPVTEDKDGHSCVSAAGMWPKDRETIFPLQAAAGYAMIRGLFQYRDNVLVEGISDYYLLTALSQHCRDAGLVALPDALHMTPCGGVPMVGKLASLFLGERVRPLILLDGDKAGRDTRTTLFKELYKGNEDGVLLLDDVVGGEGREVEDLVGEQAYLTALESVLGIRIVLEAEDRELPSLAKQVIAAARRTGSQLPDGWKASVALQLVRDWADQRAECPPAALEQAARLFEAVRVRITLLRDRV